jgi:hypothetical protein
MRNQIFKKHGYLGFIICVMVVWAGVLSIYAQPSFAQAQGPSDKQPVSVSTAWFISTMVFLLVITGGFLGYMYILQRRFFSACRDEKQMALFFQSPAGLPVGTVRSVLALLIVTISLYFIVLQAFRGLPFPESLTALIGAVIGFYFGGRSAAKEADETLQDQVKQLKTERDQAVAEKDAGQTDTLLKKVQKGITLTKTAASLLPANMRSKYDGTIAKLERGVTMIDSLSQMGKTAEAVAKTDELFKLFKADNPVRDIVEKASQSFGRVLGGAIPPLAIIGGIVGVSTKLVGVAYQKWKARILHLPFSPAVIPLEVVDANTGLVLFLQSPIFKTAFMEKLEANDRPFMESAIQEFLRQEEIETLWAKYKDHFESREQFEEGLEEFRRAAANLELKRAIDPALLVEVGGYDPLISNLDRIYADPEARADLDALVTVTEGLQRNNEPAKSIFDKVREEVSS